MVPPHLAMISAYKREQSKRTFYFSIIVIINLIGIACLLLAWKTHSVNATNIFWALIFIGTVFAICFVACLFGIYLLCIHSNINGTLKRRFDVQTVYPTPEFQYFTNTMLQRVQKKRSSRNSDFSAISTAQVSSDGEKKNASTNCNLEANPNISLASNESRHLQNFKLQENGTLPMNNITIPEIVSTTNNDLRSFQRFRLYDLEACTV